MDPILKRGSDTGCRTPLEFLGAANIQNPEKVNMRPFILHYVSLPLGDLVRNLSISPIFGVIP